MSKFIIFILFGIAVYWLLRKKRLDSGTREKKPPASAEAMVGCVYCGLHVPRSESVVVDGRYYCSEEHRRLDSGDQRE